MNKPAVRFLPKVADEILRNVDDVLCRVFDDVVIIDCVDDGCCYRCRHHCVAHSRWKIGE